jgi:hypothetical protein
MKTLFIKSGDYTPSIFFDTAGAINELHKMNFGQLVRANALFTLMRMDSGFVIVEGGEVKFKTPISSAFSFTDFFDYLNHHPVVFYGVVVTKEEIVSTPSILAGAQPFYFEESEKIFYSLTTKQPLRGDQIISLFYMFKMNNSDAYACIMNNLVAVDAFTVNGPNDGIFDDQKGRVVFSDTGNSIRSKLIAAEFSNNVIKMDYGHFLPTQTVCVKAGESFTLKVFNEKVVMNDENFSNGFGYELKTPLKFDQNKDKFTFSAPSTPQTSFVSLQIKGTQMYDYITVGNSFEKLSLNFLVLVY